jgi:uncharacterized membrane protein
MRKSMLLIRALNLGARLYLRELDRRNRRRELARGKRNKALAFAGGAGLGAGLMYLLDPDGGRRRRKLLNDQVASLMYRSDDALGRTARDLRNRTRGLLTEARARFEGQPASDEVLAARVRSKLGLVVSHPSAIEVAAVDGRVILSGSVLASEADQLLLAIVGVRGVREVENRLEVHDRAGTSPALQGGAPPPGQRFALMQTNWSPTARLLSSAAGGGLALYGATRRDALGVVLGAMGFGLLVRGLSNVEISRLLGLSSRHTASVQKTINVNAPIEYVFKVWSSFDNFPRFMSHLRGVKDLGNHRSHWIAEGPAGVPIEWDAVMTTWVPNSTIAWRSLPGSLVANAGTVRFVPNPDGSTRVDVKLSYTPPAGALGHAVAKLFGADPKSAMDEDLVRFKSLIEEGKTSARDKTVTREDLDFGRALERGAALPSQQIGPDASLHEREVGGEPTD